MRASESLEPAFFALLGVEGRRALEDRLVASVAAELSACHAGGVPVRLSKVAPRFGVQSNPERGNLDVEASIDYDRQKGCFVIRLGRRCFSAPRLSQRLLFGLRSDGDTVRDRFAYAHELVHRFFFVPASDDTWRRAVTILLEREGQEDRLTALRKVSQLEERICNTVAARLLVPWAEVQRWVADWYDNGEGSVSLGPYDNLFAWLQAGAARFQASKECFLMSTRDAVRAGDLALESGYLSMLVRKSSQVGRWYETRNCARALIPILQPPREEPDARPPFPGLPLSSLSVELEAELEAQAFRKRARRGGGFDLPVVLNVGKGRGAKRDARRFRFAGQWGSWSEEGLGTTLFVWGRVSGL